MPAGRTAHREGFLPGTPLAMRRGRWDVGLPGTLSSRGAVLRHTARGLAIESPGHSP